MEDKEIIGGHMTQHRYPVYENGVFSTDFWPATTLVSPARIRKYTESTKLEGRVIDEVHLVGMCYNFDRDSLEDQVWRKLSNYEDEKERRYRSRYENFDSDIPLMIYTVIDEPMLIRFSDGDVLDILVDYEREYSMSMNSIPWDIQFGCNAPNIDANIIFHQCNGRSITGIEINTCIKDAKDWSFATVCEPDYTGNEFVSNMVLRLDNGSGLRFDSWYDYCVVSHIDSMGNIITRPFKEIKRGIIRIY